MMPFTEAEIDCLHQLLEKELRELRLDEHRADSLEFKRRLREKIALMEGLLARTAVPS